MKYLIAGACLAVWLWMRHGDDGGEERELTHRDLHGDDPPPMTKVDRRRARELLDDPGPG